MAVYQCPLQADINSLQTTANKAKNKACELLLNKGWALYYYGQNKQLAINLNAIKDDTYHSFKKCLSELNYSQDIIDFCKTNIEEDDYVVF